MSDAAQNIAALFSGFPDWRRRIMGVLQAAIDDSGRGQPPYLILAGCILDVERWIAFTDIWKTILDEHPKIEYFKMKEANGLEGQFAEFTEPERDKKLWKFVSALLLHRPHAVQVLIDTDAYVNHFNGRIAKEMNYPTFMAFFEIISAVIRAQISGAISDEAAVKFVFDEQGKESDMFLYTWSVMHEPDFPSPPFDPRLMPSRPAFEDDKKFLPLQVADLLAWHYRWAKVNEGKDLHNPFWEAIKTIPCEKSELNEERLMKMTERVRRNSDSMGCMFEYQMPQKDRKVARKSLAQRKAIGRSGGKRQ